MSENINNTSLQAFGLKATWIYLIALFGGIPTAAFFGILNLKPLYLNELGDFFAGAFGPLAIFWLVLGFFQQGRELQNSVDALNLQAEELRNSVEQQTALVKVSEQQHRLELESRQDDALARRNSQVPFLLLEFESGGSSGGDHYLKFDLRNRNGDATKIIFETGTEEIRVSPESKTGLMSGKVVRAILHADDVFKSFGDHATLTTKSYSSTGAYRIQVFSLSVTDYPMISEQTVET